MNSQSFVWIAAVSLGVTALADEPRMRKSEILRATALELARPVRPGGVDGHPFWNAYSIYFQYPPVLEFKPVADAACYVAKVYSDAFETWELPCGERPWADLTSVWPKLKGNGFVHVVCRGRRADGSDCGLAGERTFMKTASFTGGYPRGKWTYAEAARRIFDYVFDATPQAEFRRTGRPYPKYRKNAYPAKMHSALIQMCLAYAKVRPDRRDEAMRFACMLCDYLMSVSEPAGAPLEHLAPTYVLGFGHPVAQAYFGQTMILEPVQAIRAALSLSQEIKGEQAERAKKYLDYAERGAKTLARLQLEDGSWPVRLSLKTGRPPELVRSAATVDVRTKEGLDLRRNRAFPLPMAGLYDALFRETGKEEYRRVSERAFAYVTRADGPLATYNWEGQFEDGPPTPPYVNLTQHPACSCAIYLLEKFPDDPKRVAEARELLRFAEDQFVVWERPVRGDGEIMTSKTCPQINGNWNWRLSSVREWQTPGALEQYDCYNPIDSSNAKLVQTYIASYRATKNPLDLEKARALADSIVNMTPEDGNLPTHWMGSFTKGQENWTNCQLASANALFALARLLGEE